VSIDASPPAQPPQLSPDGNWVWDGSQWQPVVAVEPTHQGVFPSWNGITVEPADPAAAVTPPAAVAYQAQAPVPAMDYSSQPDEPVELPWQQPNKGVSFWLYPVAGVAILVVLMLVLNAIGFIQMPWIGSGSSTQNPAARASPAPDFSGPDAARADHFLNGELKPALAAFDQTVAAFNRDCAGIASTSCFDSLTASQQQVKKLIGVVNNSDVPSCISGPVNRIRLDVKGMDEQLQVAFKGFNDNNRDELFVAVNHFETYRQAIDGEVATANVAQKKCLPVVVPTWVPR
jgi:hypothetical protein